MSLATPANLRRLQRALYAAAKRDPVRRFHVLYDKVWREDILAHAFALSRENGGAPGVDGVTFAQIETYGVARWLGELREEVRTGRYTPQPVRRVMIPKSGGVGQRPLGIPTIRDRVVQTAAKLVIGPIFEADFDEAAYGYRPRRSAHDAIRIVHKALDDGRTEVVDADLSQSFDEIPHEPLLDAVAERVADGSVLRLVRLFLEALIQDGYRLVRPRAGTPQGGVVSPLLANIYLARLDRVLEAEGVGFVRYADDVRLSSRTPSGARQALKRTAEVLQGLGLRLSKRKTKLVTAYQGVDFLGYRLVVRKGRLHVYISPKVLERFREEVRRLTRRTAGRSLRVVMSRLDRYLRGWGEYFKRAEVAGVFDRYDRWITRRLRAYLAKRWRNGLWRRYPDQWFWFHLGLTRLYHLRRNFVRDFAARRGAGNRPVERSAGNPHATFVRGTEAPS